MWVGYTSVAQPVLPDLAGNTDNGVVLLSWTCQFDGVKSIAVLRSADSTFNYSTVGYVKKLYRGVQAFADGHPMPGKNYYKLSIVFNSGLTWGSNHYGVYVDSGLLKNARRMPSNEALQIMIVTEQDEKTVKAAPPKVKKNQPPANRDNYTEVVKKEPETAPDPALPKPKLTLSRSEEDDLNISNYVETLAEEKRKKISVSYQDDPEAIDQHTYITTDNQITEIPSPEPKKKINITFDDKDDVAAFVESLPKSTDRKITISYTADSEGTNRSASAAGNKQPENSKKKISVTFKDGEEVYAYMEALPKLSNSKITISYLADAPTAPAKLTPIGINPVNEEKPGEEPPRPKISIRFKDEPVVNSYSDVKSKYVSSDPGTGHIRMFLPDDIAMHHYAVKFFDKENHMVLEVPKINTARIIIDKRNFQKKGTYKFTIKKDGLELETGYVTIY